MITLRIILGIALALATALFFEKTRGYFRYVAHQKDKRPYTILNLAFYGSITVLGVYDFMDNMVKLIHLILK